MRILIVAAGRMRGPEAALYEAFARRVSWPLELVEVEERRKLPPAERVHREGALILGRIPPDALLVALDGRGRALSSEQLAMRLGDWRDGGIGTVAFAIGGADGLDRAVTAKAGLVLSLGPMTWPHFLARSMLAEQIYRAEAILAGHPYHRAGPPPE